MSVLIKVGDKPVAWITSCLKTPHYNKFLKKFNKENSKDLNADERKLVFLMTIEGFLNWNITLDELSAIGGDLFYYSRDDNKDEEFVSALISADEISWSIRNIKENNEISVKSVGNYMLDIIKYFNRNKYLL